MNQMKQVLCTLALLLWGAVSFAQNKTTQTKPPCLSPELEIYDDKQVKLTEGAIPTGKVTLRLKKNNACQEGVKYEVQAFNITLARGYIAMEQTTVGGNMLDLAELKSKVMPGDRMVLFLLVKYTAEKGKAGETNNYYTWIFK
ncbi:hypothetical protein [Nibribacter koreensis]